MAFLQCTFIEMAFLHVYFSRNVFLQYTFRNGFLQCTFIEMNISYSVYLLQWLLSYKQAGVQREGGGGGQKSSEIIYCQNTMESGP